MGNLAQEELAPPVPKDQQGWQIGQASCDFRIEVRHACLERGRVVLATDGHKFLGVAACRWRAERAFAGWSMLEQFVVPEAQGRGLGATLQRGLMQRLPPGDLVWGTIHAANIASQVTAARCGREIVETWWFVPLSART